MRTATTRPQIRPSVPRYSPGPHVYLRRSTSNRVCPFCKQAGRSNFHHFLSESTHLPEEDRRYMAKVRQVINLLDDEDEQNSPEPEVSNTEVVDSEHPVVQNIEVRQSPRFCRHHTTRVTIDSGATGNMIRHSTAHELGCVIEKSSQSDHQADGSSPLSIFGETSISLTRDNNTFTFNGLVVDNLDVEILAGTPFMEANDITIRPVKHLITLSSGTTYTYGSTHSSLNRHAVRRV